LLPYQNHFFPCRNIQHCLFNNALSKRKSRPNSKWNWEGLTWFVMRDLDTSKCVRNLAGGLSVVGLVYLSEGVLSFRVGRSLGSDHWSAIGRKETSQSASVRHATKRTPPLVVNRSSLLVAMRRQSPRTSCLTQITFVALPRQYNHFFGVHCHRLQILLRKSLCFDKKFLVFYWKYVANRSFIGFVFFCQKIACFFVWKSLVSCLKFANLFV